MLSVALKMLFGDRNKLIGLVLGVAFSTLLVAQQSSLFVGLMKRSQNVISDIAEAKIWVMDPLTEYVNLTRPMRDGALFQVRGVSGVEWAVPILKASTPIRALKGPLKNAMLIGIDDGTLIGFPQKIILGSILDLRRPDSIAIDRVGYMKLWPGEPLNVGRSLEINDRRAVIVAITDAAPAFSANVIIHTRYSQASRYIAARRRLLSFILVGTAPGQSIEDVATRISRKTGLRAYASERFSWETVNYYLRKTGIPMNFATTILLGIIVGAAVVGLTFHAFVMENMKHFAALKVVGVANSTIAMMALVQAGTAGAIGYGLGIGGAACFFEFVCGPTSALRGMILPVWVAIFVGVLMGIIILLSTVMSVRRLFVADPAVVLRA